MLVLVDAFCFRCPFKTRARTVVFPNRNGSNCCPPQKSNHHPNAYQQKRQTTDSDQPTGSCSSHQIMLREILDANVRWAKCLNPSDCLFHLMGARVEGDWVGVGGVKFPSNPLGGGISQTRLEGN